MARLAVSERWPHASADPNADQDLAGPASALPFSLPLDDGVGPPSRSNPAPWCLRGTIPDTQGASRLGSLFGPPPRSPHARQAFPANCGYAAPTGPEFRLSCALARCARFTLTPPREPDVDRLISAENQHTAPGHDQSGHPASNCRAWSSPAAARSRSAEAWPARPIPRPTAQDQTPGAPASCYLLVTDLPDVLACRWGDRGGVRPPVRWLPRYVKSDPPLVGYAHDVGHCRLPAGVQNGTIGG